MTKLEALALAVFSIIVMFGVFWGKAFLFDIEGNSQMFERSEK